MEGLATTKVSRAELIQACALDGLLYGRTFFPKTFKQDSPSFHNDIWTMLEIEENRYNGVKVYREGAKTTLTRVLGSKRIAYGLSRFIIFTSEAEKHAVYSVQWLRRQCKYNRLWTETFQLRLGKAAEGEIEIIHEGLGHTVRIVALGMSGQLRGFNIDDDRPDFIVADDVDGDKSISSETVREKNKDLFFGALVRSLVAPTENPNAKVVVLQTPTHREDIIETVSKDPRWHTLKFGCFDERGNSRWPARHPTQFLLDEKESYIRGRNLSKWMREMECEIVAEETRSFHEDWLNYWDILPDGLVYYMAIDPAPLGTNEPRQDVAYQAVSVIGCAGPQVFLVEYGIGRGQGLDELAAEVFRLFLKYRPIVVAVETIAYQKVCAWYLKQESFKRQIFLPIQEIQDRQNKDSRIIDSIRQIAANGHLFVHRSHHEFLREYLDFPDPERKDVIDATAMAVKVRNPAITSQATMQATDTITQAQRAAALGAP